MSLCVCSRYVDPFEALNSPDPKERTRKEESETKGERKKNKNGVYMRVVQEVFSLEVEKKIAEKTSRSHPKMLLVSLALLSIERPLYTRQLRVSLDVDE